jgi:glycine/D-amino acid oxidase-like deaminating enzyme
MKLHSAQPYWLLRNGLVRSYPSLHETLTADVVVIGAGITGAMIADELSKAGMSVIVLDGRDVGAGSTCASTALLQYEMDVSLQELQELCGSVANDLYRSGLEACEHVRRLSEEVDADVGFRARPSCYLASTADDAAKLQSEAAVRQAQGIPVEFWDEAAVRSHFDFAKPAALWSTGAAEVDPYRLTHALLQRISQRKGKIFDRSPVRDVELHPQGITFLTEHGSATGRHGVIAAGYESQTFLPKPVAKLISTFAFVSEPLEEFPGWPERCLIWESARPYLYLRTTADGRLMAGGEDVEFRNERLRDKLLESRVAKIEARVRAMFPRIPFEIDYAWAGTFGETLDNLPFIGPHAERPALLFALCYGGNGITFSVLAAAILREYLQGRRHPLAAAVAFDRETRQ